MDKRSLLDRPFWGVLVILGMLLFVVVAALYSFDSERYKIATGITALTAACFLFTGLVSATYSERTRLGKNAKPLLMLLSFIPPVLILYIYNSISFEWIWKGRLFLVIFLWLVFLELILNRDKLPEQRLLAVTPSRIIPTIIITAAPMAYVTTTTLFRLDLYLGEAIGLSEELYSGILYSWRLSLEYLLFAAVFTTLSLLLYRTEGLKLFSISTFFIWAVGTFYMVDTLYPEGQFTILQNIVPLIVSVVTSTLGPMGYDIGYDPSNFLLLVTKPGSYPFLAQIFWPCAGVYSIFIYTFVILLFLKGTAISLKGKIVYFAVGAVGTFFVNALRVATLCKLAVDRGPEAGKLFHTYYGELFFIAWIIIYPLIIFGSHKLWMRLSKSKVVQDRF